MCLREERQTPWGHTSCLRTGQRVTGFLLPLVLLLPVILSTGSCVLHPLSGGERALELLGPSEESDNEELAAALLALNATPVEEVSGPITLFHAGSTSGDMGGLSGANAMCNASPNRPPETTALAMLSTSDQDLIDLPGVPADTPVIGPNGSLIESSWADLFGTGGSIETSMYEAGVLPFPSNEFYTGTNLDGRNDPGLNCSDWNPGVPSSEFGGVGIANLTTDSWLNHTDPPTCDNFYYLLCAAW